MEKNKSNHKYLLSLYSRVDEFLSNNDIIQDELPDSIVSFCIVVEKFLKIKLHSTNPFLVFDFSCIKDDNNISVIALKKEKNIKTSKIENILDRFKIIFNKIFTSDELQAIIDIYYVRNHFVHGYKDDSQIDFDSEDVVKKMGTVWKKISGIAVSMLGGENISKREPKKIYTEKELEKALEEEVRKMIYPINEERMEGIHNFACPANYPTLEDYSFGKRCPRCGSSSFSLNNNKNDWQDIYSPVDITLTSVFPVAKPNLYKCRHCNLELTEKQYEIAKKILYNKKF